MLLFRSSVCFAYFLGVIIPAVVFGFSFSPRTLFFLPSFHLSPFPLLAADICPVVLRCLCWVLFINHDCSISPCRVSKPGTAPGKLSKDTRAASVIAKAALGFLTCTPNVCFFLTHPPQLINLPQTYGSALWGFGIFDLRNFRWQLWLNPSLFLLGLLLLHSLLPLNCGSGSLWGTTHATYLNEGKKKKKKIWSFVQLSQFLKQSLNDNTHVSDGPEQEAARKKGKNYL